MPNICKNPNCGRKLPTLNEDGFCHNEHCEYKIPYTIDNAVRDICSASITTASKSKVREILERLLVNYKRKSKKGVK